MSAFLDGFADLMRKLTQPAAGSHEWCPFADLTPGDTIRHAGDDWNVAEISRHEGWMTLLREDGGGVETVYDCENQAYLRSSAGF